jgi:NAD+ kinase
VITHGQAGQIGAGLARLQAVAAEHAVDLLFPPDEAEKHGVEAAHEPVAADIAVVLGGDGTVLRALTRFLGTGVPVVGVNFGRVGFLSSMGRRELEAGMARVFAGEYDVVELPTLEVEHPDGTGRAVNDVVVASAELGRMIELELVVGGEELGRQPCDGIICSTPSGSTAYNLSNGGPVLMWGLERWRSCSSRPLAARAPIVIPPGATLVIRTDPMPAASLVGTAATISCRAAASSRASARSAPARDAPEATFFRATARLYQAASRTLS